MIRKGEKLKIIFLDVDGVINTNRNHFTKLDEIALEYLKIIIESTGAKIVISSSWRTGSLEETKKYFPTWLQEYIISETESKHKYCKSDFYICRGNEIQDWLNKNVIYPWQKYPELSNEYLIINEDGTSTNCSKSNELNIDYTYVILDDDSDMLYDQRNNFIQTNMYKGLRKNDIKKAIKILNQI